MAGYDVPSRLRQSQNSSTKNEMATRGRLGLGSWGWELVNVTRLPALHSEDL